jgi:oligoribonuclease (3'-5' exoribonuclease)
MNTSGLLAWTDLETTGLVPRARNTSQILEIGIVITQGNNFEPLEQLDLVIHFESRCDAPEAQAMHEASGLLAECAKSALTLPDAIVQAAGWLARHGGERPIMAGNSIHFYIEWFKAYAPSFLDLYHYRRIDVSGVNELLRTQGAHLESKDKAHRSIADIFKSIDLARHCVQKLCVA